MDRRLAWKHKHLAAGCCTDCGEPAFRGVRCLYHEVRRYFRRHGLVKFRWYWENEEQFVRALRARLKVWELGEDPGPTAPVVEAFTSGARATAGEENKFLIERAIALFDKVTKEKRNESDRRIEAA